MGIEIWYRGEGVGVAPAKPGGVSHDLKDGMYFADTERVAGVYASERAPRPQDRRIYSVSIDRGTMRVLDLTTHPEWQKLMQMRLPNGDTPEMMLRRQPAAQEYEKWFNSFLKTNKIDLNQYDAVIGPEYRNGGKQLAILSKKGKVPPLHTKIRRMFRQVRPIPARMRSSIPKINIKTRMIRIAGGIRGFSGSPVGQIAVVVIFTLIKRWLDKKALERNIEKELKKIEPEITDKLEKLKPDIARFQLKLDKGEKIFANITTEIHWSTKSLGAGRGSYLDADVYLRDVDISTKDLNFERSYNHMHTSEYANHPEYSCKVDQYVQSVEVEVYSEEEIERFRDLSYEYLSYYRKLMIDPHNPVLVKETTLLRQEIVEAYKVDVWFLNAINQ